MSQYIKRFPQDSEEHSRLRELSRVLTDKSPNRWHYFVGDVYFDYGQNWWWTTVLCNTGRGGITGSYQALCPADQEKLLDGDGSQESIEKLANVVLSGKFCPDRIKEAVSF